MTCFNAATATLYSFGMVGMAVSLPEAGSASKMCCPSVPCQLARIALCHSGERLNAPEEGSYGFNTRCHCSHGTAGIIPGPHFTTLSVHSFAEPALLLTEIKLFKPMSHPSPQCHNQRYAATNHHLIALQKHQAEHQVLHRAFLK